MKILLYGIPAETAGRIAARHEFEVTASLDEKGGAAGAMLAIPPIASPGQLLSLYNTLIAREDEIDAVIVGEANHCDAYDTIRYGSPQGKFFTLSGDEETLEYEFERIVESLLGLLCAHEGI